MDKIVKRIKSMIERLYFRGKIDCFECKELITELNKILDINNKGGV